MANTPDNYYQVEVLIPSAQMPTREDLDEVTDTLFDFAHDLFRDRAIAAGRQQEGDCGNPDGPGCEGCSLGCSGSPITV